MVITPKKDTSFQEGGQTCGLGGLSVIFYLSAQYLFELQSV